MLQIVNNTDLNINRLLVLYAEELNTVKYLYVELIVFKDCRMIVWGRDSIILDVNDNVTNKGQVK